jgi:hypothetical protein
MKPPLILASILALASCSSPPPKENLPDRSTTMPDRGSRADEIVALFNGEPLTWQTVAEKVLELNLRESVDQYVRWRIVDDRRKALGITHTPEELKKRAAVYLEQIKKQIGEERFRQQLAREGATEESKRAQLEGSALLSQVLTLDKIVRFAAMLEDQLEIDRVYFADEAEARKFKAEADAKGFEGGGEGAADEPVVRAGPSGARGVSERGPAFRPGAGSPDRGRAPETPSGRGDGSGKEQIQFVLCRATSGNPEGPRGRIFSSTRRAAGRHPEGSSGAAGVPEMDGERGRPMPDRVFGRSVEEGAVQGIPVTTQYLCILVIF